MTPDLILALGLLAADASQTTYIAQHPQQYQEYNPILGQHPSRGKVAAYFLSAGAGLVVLNNVLPEKYARALNVSTIALEAACVGHNAHVGIKFSF